MTNYNNNSGYSPTILKPAVLAELINIVGATALGVDQNHADALRDASAAGLSPKECQALDLELSIKSGRMKREDAEFIKKHLYNPNGGDSIVFELMEAKKFSPDLQIQRYADSILGILLRYFPELWDDVNHEGLRVVYKAVQLGDTYMFMKMQDAILCGFIDLDPEGPNARVGSDAVEKFAGKTVLHIAAMQQGVEFDLPSVFLNKLDINATDARGQTALHLAAESGNYSFVRDCLFNSPELDINAQDGNGNTIMHYVARGYDADLMGYLIEYGADSHIENNRGLSPIDEAMSLGAGPSSELFEKFGVETSTGVHEDTQDTPEALSVGYDTDGHADGGSFEEGDA